MKILNQILIIAVIASGLVFAKKFFFTRAPQELPKYGQYLSCQGDAYDYRVKFKSDIYFLKDALPSLEEAPDRLYYPAIYYQNMYSFSNMVESNPNTSLKWSSLTEKDPKINVLAVEDAEYPYHAELDPEINTGGLPEVAVTYVKNLSALGKIQKGSPAVKVTYEYENDLILCFDKNARTTFKDIKYIQPLDPYTAYFAIPISERKFFENKSRFASATINPCMNPAGIPPQGYAPMGFWYNWIPFAEGHDSHGKPFNCKDYYQEGITVKTLDIEFNENPPKDVKPFDLTAFDNLDRPLSIAVVFGAQESYQFRKFQEEEVSNYIKKYLSGINIQEARDNLPYSKGKYDMKLSILLWFMKNVTQNIDIKGVDTRIEDYLLRVDLKGKFKLSKKDVHLKLIMAPNNPKFEGMEYFSKSFAEEFLKNDIVSYEGHVNAGSIFAPSFTEYKDLLMSSQNKDMKYQLFAIHSCEASFFFDPVKFPKVDNPEFKRDIIRTAGPYIDGAANPSLALIGQLDSYLYNNTYVPFAYWSKMAKSDNFFILSNH